MILSAFYLGWFVRNEILSLPLTLKLVWEVFRAGPGVSYTWFQTLYQRKLQTGRC